MRHPVNLIRFFIFSAALWSVPALAALSSGHEIKLTAQKPDRLVLQYRSSHATPSFLKKEAGGPSERPATTVPDTTLLLLLPPAGSWRLTVNEVAIREIQAFSDYELPAVFAEMTGVGLWRGRRIGRLTLRPFIRRNGKTFKADSLLIEIQFQRAGQPLHRLAPQGPADRWLLKRVLNPQMDYSLTTRTKPVAQSNDSLAFGQEPAVKIYIRESGMYRLSYEQIRSLGLIDAEKDSVPKEFHLWHRGKKIPLFYYGDGDPYFEAGEEIWFYGQRIQGENQWFNDETWYNVYWLARKDGPGLIYRVEPPPDTAAGHRLTSFFQWLHFEDDESYYHGDSETGIYTTARVPGEGWIWDRLIAGDSLVHEPLLGAIAAGQGPCSLRVRIRGITRTSIKPNHHFQVWINRFLVADTLFSDNQEIVLQTSFPSDYLQEGKNRVVLRSVGDTGAPIDQFYVDWYELGIPRSLKAEGGTLTLEVAPIPGQSGPARFKVTGLPDSTAFVFNLTDRTRLAILKSGSEPGGTFFIEVADSIATFSRILITTPQAVKQPELVEFDRPSSYRSPEQGADYVIITHERFRNAAEKLADYRREQDGFRVITADIRDIYDEFNYGIESAEAIRAFLAYAYRNWQPPAPSFVVLIGDGSWDPKMNSPFSTKENFIPVFGNPVSDSRLACLDGPEDFLPDLFIGRLPVETPEQADEIVDKIITYETQPLEDWSKDFTFITGGINAYEHNLFISQSEKLIAEFVETRPVVGKVTRIYKKTEGRIRGELLPEILDAFAAGNVMVSYAGHAGSRTWELMMTNEDIPKLSNTDRYPFIASMTCHTARFANPELNAFGEDFLRIPGRGTVGFWSTSGWGFAFQDGVLLEGLFKAITQDTVRRVGVATTLAKLHLWQQYGALPININLIDQYTLLGDPALRLRLPTRPDLTVAPHSIKLDPEFPTTADTLMSILVTVRNRGLVPTDSVAVALRIVPRESNRPAFQSVKKLPAIGYADTVLFLWSGEKAAGTYHLEVSIDAENRILEVDETNNTASVTMQVQSAGIELAVPQPYQVLPAPNPVLSVYQPPPGFRKERRFYFEVDTTLDFNSPVLMRSGPVAGEPVRTAWRVPGSLEPGLYFWRVRYEEPGRQSPWQVSTFFVDPEVTPTAFRQEGKLWAPFGTRFMLHAQGVALPIDSSNVHILEVVSAGEADGNRCELRINGEQQNAPGRGIHVLALDLATREPIAGPSRFDLANGESAGLLRFLQRLPERSLLLAGIQGGTGGAVPGEIAGEFEKFGSKFIRTVQASDSWALIGIKGLRPGDAREAYRAAGEGPAAVADTVAAFVTSAELQSPKIGPAVSWKAVRWQPGESVSLFPVNFPASETKVTVEIYGLAKAEQSWKLLFTSDSENVDLGTINALEFPFLQLKARLSTTNSLVSPSLEAWEVEYEQGGDLVLPAYWVSVNRDTVYPGEVVSLSGQVIGFGNLLSDSVTIRLREFGRSGFAETTLPLRPNTPQPFTLEWMPEGRGLIKFDLTADPGNRIDELYETNNRLQLLVFGARDKDAPRLHLLFDGKEPADEEYISGTPVIEGKIYDESPAAVQDTSVLQVYLDGRKVYLADPKIRFVFEPVPEGVEEMLRARFRMQYPLEPGRHRFRFVLSDRFGHSAEYTYSLIYEPELKIVDLMNYPNPMRHETSFTFTLTRPAVSGRIKIFSLSGKLLHVLEFIPEVGYNQIPWNGRDDRGDLLANGVYLYKLMISDGQTQLEKIGKIAIAR